MAKKKNELSYLQMPLPEGRKSSKMTKRSWSGLNYRQVIDTGALSMEKNISTLEAPYLTPSQKHEIYKEKYSIPIGLYAFDDILIVIYNRKDEGASSHTIYIDYINWDGDIFTGVLKYDASDSPDDIDNCQRSIVQFNKYDVLTDPLTGQYMKKLLIFPDKVSIPMRFEYAVSNPKEWDKDVCKTKSRDTMYVYYDDNDNLHHYYTIHIYLCKHLFLYLLPYIADLLKCHERGFLNASFFLLSYNYYISNICFSIHIFLFFVNHI